MKSFWTLILILLLSCEARAGDAEDGFAVAQKYCASCHAVGLDGESRLRKATPFREIARQSQGEALGGAVANGLTTGRHPPISRTATEGNTARIIAYIKSLQR